MEMQTLVNDIQSRRVSACRVCAEAVSLYSSKGMLLYCTNKLCPIARKKVSLWKDTVFHYTKLEKTKILQIIELWVNKFNVNEIAFVLKISRQNITNVLKRLTTILVPLYYKSLDEDIGNSQTWEIDESKFGKRKYNRGHPVEGVWVLGFAQKGGDKKVRLIQIEKRDKITLTQAVINNVQRGSELFTDGWRGYVDLGVNGFDHKTVNHSEGFVNQETGVHTNTIEGIWCAVKRDIPIRARTKKLINAYLVRYMIRKNEKGNPFLNLLKYIF